MIRSSVVSREVSTMFYSFPPTPSGYKSLVQLTATHWICPSGVRFVAILGPTTSGTSVTTVHVITMRPAVVIILVPALGLLAALSVVVVVAAVLSLALAETSYDGILVGQLLGKSLVGFRQVGHELPIRGRCSSEIREGIGGLCDKGIHCIVGAVKTGALGCLLGEAKIGMGFGKGGFEMIPCLVCCWATSPLTASIREHAGVEDQRVRIGDNLCSGVGSTTSGGEIHGIFNLSIQGLDGLRWVIRLSEKTVIGCEVRWSEVPVGVE